MASRKLTDAHIILQKQFEKAKPEFEKQYPGVIVFLTCTHRSNDEQNQLYNQPFDGKDNNGNGKIDEPGEKVTQAKGGQSPHNYLPSYAIDVAFDVKQSDGKFKTDWSEKYFKLFAPFMANPNIEWGGTWKFKDMPHYEIKGWKTLIKK